MNHESAGKIKQTSQKKRSITPEKAAARLAPVHAILQLQPTIGNQGILRLLHSGEPRRDPRKSVKLTIGNPGDMFEREADRVTEQMMAVPDPQKQRQKEGEGSGIAASASGGSVQPLPNALRRYFEPRFGYDFSSVRLHTDSSAAESARALRARAYTAGRHVVFGSGQYAPETDVGRRLLAHELTHVVQQTGGFRHIRRKEIEGGAASGGPEEEDLEFTGGGVLQRTPTNGTPQALTTAERVRAKWPNVAATAGGVAGRRVQRSVFHRRSGAMGSAGTVVQCKIGDGHDLTHPRFKGNLDLQAAYDNERYIRRGSRGAAVSILQQALVDLGYGLPKYGADGKFEGETRTTVVQFQTAKHIGIDGIVGEETLTALQNSLGGGAGPPPPAPPPAPPPLNVTVPGNIRATNTHANASDRIPPRKNTPANVKITGLTPAMGTVKVSVKNTSAANGQVTVNGAASVNLAATATANLKGTAQTAKGNAGNLKLVAEHGGGVVATSAGFSVAAIPTDFSTTFNSIVKDPGSRRMLVNNHHKSDSGQLADLDQAKRSEQVQYGAGTGTLAGFKGANSGYLAANVSPRTDRHSTATTRFKSPGGKVVAEQVFIYKCDRTGDVDIPVNNSGFRLTREIFENPPASGTWDLRMSKVGTATTANGFATGAGTGSVIKILHL